MIMNYKEKNFIIILVKLLIHFLWLMKEKDLKCKVLGVHHHLKEKFVI